MYRKNTKSPDKHHNFNSLNVFFFTDDFLIVPGGDEILIIPYQRVVESYKGERRDKHTLTGGKWKRQWRKMGIFPRRRRRRNHNGVAR